MHRPTLRTAALVALAALISGCTHYMPWQATPSNAPLDPPGYKVVGPAQGKACRKLLLGSIPIGKSNNRYQAAIDDALSRSGGDALIEMTMDISFTWYPFVSFNCTHVNGLAVKRGR